MAGAQGRASRRDAMGFAAFAGHKYLNLETFKKNGEGVKTPVWFAADASVSLDSSDAKLYVYTIGVSGKVNASGTTTACELRHATRAAACWANGWTRAPRS